VAWTKTKSAIVAGMLVLSAFVIVILALKVIEAHRPQVWRVRLDTSVLDRGPRQAKILPALHSRSKDVNGWDEYHGMLLGLDQPLPEIIFAAYKDSSGSISRGRVIFSVSVPEGTFDFISNVSKNQAQALQQEIKKKFGLVGRREFIETNVLVLTVRNPGARGLKRLANAAAAAHVNRSNGFISWSNHPISTLRRLLENNMRDTENNRLGIPVVDRTGLGGFYDLNWDSTHDPVEKAVLDQVGLELVPGKDRIEFLVVGKTN